MPYISELLNNTITDSSDVSVGKLEDILIAPKADSFAPLEFLVIKTHQGRKFVPYEYVANFNSSEISLKNLFNKVAQNELPAVQFVYLKKQVLDKQIVDVAGTRVVRVNDLRIGNFENKVCVLGIDSSFKGILRRLGLAGSIFGKPFSVSLIDWRQATLVDSKKGLELNTVAEDLSHLHPADLANIVEDLDVKFGSSLLASLDSTEAAKVLEEVDPKLQTVLVKYLGPERAGKIMSQMSSDEFVDLVKTLSGDEANQFLSEVKGSRAQSVKKLLNYPDNTAGGLMTLDFLAVRPEWTIAQVVEEIRKVSDGMRSLPYVYVTYEESRFIGVVSLRRLLLAKSQEKIGDLAKRFPSYAFLKPGDKIEKIIQLMTKYNLYTAAVLDKEKKLVGVVTIDDVMRQLFPSA
ncbi:MAG: magnesium transporter [Candidatus Doudnabacteria bacterium]|nr:magnesium transporter [Candidatus Doudnabacteria bacterium]